MVTEQACILLNGILQLFFINFEKTAQLVKCLTCHHEDLICVAMLNIYSHLTSVSNGRYYILGTMLDTDSISR